MNIEEAAQHVLSKLIRAATPDQFVEVEVSADTQGHFPASGVLEDKIRGFATEDERKKDRLAKHLNVSVKRINMSNGTIKYLVEC